MTDAIAPVSSPPSIRADSRRWSVLGVATIASWVAVLGSWLFINVLWSVLWIMALGLIGLLGVVSAALTIAWSLRSVLYRRWVLGFAILLPAVFVAFVTLTVPWGDGYSRFWFSLHHDQFVQAEAAVRTGALVPGADYHGVSLPGPLAGIAIDGRISSVVWTGDDGDNPCPGPVEFAAAVFGIPDGAQGFVHLPCETPPPDFFLDGFGDGMSPRIRLGDGWWWADGEVR